LSQLVLRNVSRTFGGFTAVDKLNLTLREGELVSLLGPSGCGKTTTLRMIAGFITPTEGTIELDGRVISSPQSSLPPEKRGMSMIFQSYAIWPNMTVEENVAFGLKLQKAPDAKRRVDQILDVVKLGALRGRYPAELSGGQQQRVALARAIVVNPKVLLLDEPLSNLNMTMVYVTHDQAEAMVTSDRIAVMNQGRIEQIDAPFDLYRHPRTRFVAAFIGRTNLLTGARREDDVDFGGFRLPTRALAADGLLPEQVQVSIRPQSIQLLRDRPPESDARCCVEASIQRRSYLGESWDYHISLAPALEPIRVSARPSDVFEVGQRIYAEIDTSQITLVS
jgi:ABC-type Fe3+/spermidine/putrescine transport system ATPase subunit